MKQRLADYVADFCVENGISDCFMVVGGGAMHLNDAFGHKEGIHCTYNHHEQASAMAAEAYARVDNKMPVVCVTTGPGGTNALTGVMGGWLDSIPMFIISGQVRHDTTARYMRQFTQGLRLRAVGDQEFDIVAAVESMCKYAVRIENPDNIAYELEKAYHIAMTGRRGPVWIDIPVDFQGYYIETDRLEHYLVSSENENGVDTDVYNEIIDRIKKAERPVFYAGNGIRLSEGYGKFRHVIEKLGIPVVTGWDSIDLIEDDHPLYIGRAGIMGDRAGNFAVQNADVLLVVGNRLSIRQVGYNWKSWARKAYVIMVDIDPAELKKTTIHVELPVCEDADIFLKNIQDSLNSSLYPLFKNGQWIQKCREWKEKYPVTQEKHWKENGKTANVYAFIKYLSSCLPNNTVTVVSNGSACVVGSHNYVMKKGGRFIINSGAASMGYGLPAAVGACIANGNKTTICLEGDGSIMMNLQELQTIVTNHLPIKIFLINNDGYHSIRQTQNNLFQEHSKVGIGPESGDLSFPDFKKIAEAFGYVYYEAHSNKEMKQVVEAVLTEKGAAFCEIFVSTDQVFEPKSATKRLEDGTLVSPPLEDLAPFLPRKELLDNLFIEPYGE